MAQGPYIKAIENELKEIFLNYPELRSKPTEFREKLLKEYGEKFKNIYGSDFPRRSTCSKWLKKYRKIYEKRSPELKELDKPWSIASIQRYPIDPQTLPEVVQLYRYRLSMEKELTIREAKWASRLAAFKSMGLDGLSYIAFCYALAEKYSELSETSFEESRFLDNMFFKPGNVESSDSLKDLGRSMTKAYIKMIGLLDYKPEWGRFDLSEEFWREKIEGKEVQNERTHNEKG